MTKNMDSGIRSFGLITIGFTWVVLQTHSLIRINRLPDYVARWQHGSQICSSIFFSEKSQKLFITQQPLKLEKKAQIANP
jgi:hypothetical protein